ncbi:hypothetical protein Q7C_1328 [Methylophaga frappieri]|uniref:Uncharacterized protein n=1 Tax=Methylophaga frappieri (strain ATCC BAA-2434 / DSM 25690 / JAM7) TaxID=754477 RepID=I1YHT5_METFJ|nr:hypothetical protein Q7C_1328 [Methylophaga frappieri]
MNSLFNDANNTGFCFFAPVSTGSGKQDNGYHHHSFAIS